MGIQFNSPFSEEPRRKALYEGDLFVDAPNHGSTALCDLARELCEEAFDPHSPETAQYEISVEEYVAILEKLKPAFIHHPKAKRAVQDMLIEAGCDPEQTYFNVPRLRTQTSDGYLTSGLAFAFHPHRDCWYSAPMCEINWWMPVYEASSDNVMAIHPQYWDRPVRNGSADFDYHDWVEHSRFKASEQRGKETRKQPMPEEPLELDPSIRIVPEVAGFLQFAGAQLHSTLPNYTGRTRISVDFRTAHLGDMEKREGAPNVDSECTGTNFHEFIRVSDLTPPPESICLEYDKGPAELFPLRREGSRRMRISSA